MSPTDRPRPLIPDRRTTALLLALAVLARLAFLPGRTSDTEQYLLPWLHAAEASRGAYLRHAFTNYTAFYEHCLALIALVPGPDLVRIKAFSILWDGLLAATVTRLVPPGTRALAFALLLALPTVAMNSALLGQSDAIYATMVMLALWAASRGHPVWTMLACSAAIAVKLQALMVVSLLALLWLERRQPLWTFALIPIAYLAFAAPMVLAGRPAHEIFAVYQGQFDFFTVLSANAPNLWQVGQKIVGYDHGLIIGLPGALLATAAAVLALWRAGTLRTQDGLLLAAAILLMLVPFVTPKMHDRYFYLVDPVMVALACCDRRFLAPMLLAEAASLLAYLPFVADGYLRHDPLWSRDGWIAVHAGVSYRTLPLVGAVMMGAALFLLGREAWRRRRPAAAWAWPAGARTIAAT